MEEKKLTDEVVVAKNAIPDEEIAKAILQSIEYGKTITYFDEWGNCKSIFVKDILDLIHRLQGENKQLKCDSYRTSWKAKFIEAKKEIERLTEEKWNVQYDLDNYHILLREKEKQVDELTKQREVGREKLKNEIANKIFMSASHGAIQCGKMSVAIAEIEAEKYVEFAWEMVQQAVKDAAKEILQEIWEEEFEIDVDIDEKSKADVMKVGEAVLTEIHNKIKEIAKRKGVEVE